jgi:hypothetical protein
MKKPVTESPSIEAVSAAIQDQLDCLATLYGMRATALIAMPDGEIVELTGQRERFDAQASCQRASRLLN